MKKIGLILLLAGALLPLVSAAQKQEFVDSLGNRYVLTPVGRGLPYVSEHGFRVGIGAAALLPGRWGWGRYDDVCCSYPPSSPSGMMDQRRTYTGPEYTTGTLTATYDYRAARLLEVGVSFGFTQFYRKRLRGSDGGIAARNRETYYSLAPFLRLSWLNRPVVRMYSGFALGVTWMRDRSFDGSVYNHGEAAWQLTLVGISVGKRLFGYAEWGFGSYGCISAGIGYRFIQKR